MKVRSEARLTIVARSAVQSLNSFFGDDRNHDEGSSRVGHQSPSEASRNKPRSRIAER